MSTECAPPGESPTVTITFAEMVATLVLLGNQGHCDVKAGDEDGEQLAAEVIELNADWKPGAIPVVPPRFDRPVYDTQHTATQTASVVRFVGPSRGASRAPRSRSSSTRAGSRGSSSRSSSDDSDLPEPPLCGGLTPLQQASVHLREALTIARTEPRALETFLDILAIRVASEMSKRWAA